MSDRVEGLSPAKRRLLEALQAKRSSKVDKVAGELVRLRDGGSDKPPVVLIHPIGGGVFCYADLGRLIPGDRAVWAIAAGELLAKGAPPTVTQIALAYLDLLRANGVSGAAVLAGWSFGGLVAREMARQCATRPVLVLIDTAPWPSDVPAWSPAETLEVFVEDLLRSAGVTFDRVPVDSDLWNLPTEQALSAVGACLSEQGLDLKLTPSERMTRVRIFENATRAMQRHRPGSTADRPRCCTRWSPMSVRTTGRSGQRAVPRQPSPWPAITSVCCVRRRWRRSRRRSTGLPKPHQSTIR